MFEKVILGSVGRSVNWSIGQFVGRSVVPSRQWKRGTTVVANRGVCSGMIYSRVSWLPPAARAHTNHPTKSTNIMHSQHHQQHLASLGQNSRFGGQFCLKLDFFLICFVLFLDGALLEGLTTTTPNNAHNTNNTSNQQSTKTNATSNASRHVAPTD